jgi:5'(3')-deoxyribonucleotidase
MKHNIFLDMDGVLNNLGEHFIDYATIKYGERIKWNKNIYGYSICDWFTIDGKSDRKYVLDVFKEKNFWEYLSINQKIQQEIYDMGVIENNNMCICTFPFEWKFSPNIKEKFISLHYPEIDTKKNIIMMEDKSLLAGNGILIDDCPKNIRKFMDVGGEAYLYKTFYNYKEDLPMIDSLYELEGYI